MLLDKVANAQDGGKSACGENFALRKSVQIYSDYEVSLFLH